MISSPSAVPMVRLPSILFIPVSAKSVSYTHLDVYKRQEIILVEEVVDGEFQLQIQGLERKPLFERDVAHEILRQVSRQRVVVARHGETLRVIGPLVEERPRAP